MPIITATRVTVLIASDGWLFHHSSVFAMLSVTTFLFGSDNGRSLSHLLKVRPARVVGIFWESHGLSVVVPTSKEDGSKLGGAGGAGLFEVLMKAAWMGVAGGLDADGPVGPGFIASSPNCANWLRSCVSSCCVSGSAVLVGTQPWMRSATCCAAYLVFWVLSKSLPSCLAFDEHTLSMSTPLLRNWVSSSVVNTTAAMFPVGIK